MKYLKHLNMEHHLDSTDPRILAQFLEVDAEPRRFWSVDELGSILRHQLSTPVQVDVETASPDFRASLMALPSDQQPGKSTYEEVFHLAAPPLELLSLLKQLAKSSRAREESALPPEIATVVYLTSIVVARVRLGRRISEQSDASLLYGIQWVLNQTWIDEGTRLLFHEARAHFVPDAPKHSSAS
jgi:hypothetical protein